MDFEIYLVGLNYRTASVDIRERFALTEHCTRDSWMLHAEPDIRESVILSTCNRVEILATAKEDITNALLTRWAQTRGRGLNDLLPYVYVHKGLDAVKHLFTVASSLDSMVLGEPQILGQLKTAYRNAVQSNAAGAVLNRMLHKAFSVAKRVRTETAVASSAVSISYAAVELAKRIFGDMREQNAMLIGAGEMAELAATHLLQAGIKQLTVANRTLEKAQNLANQFQGRAIPFEDISEALVTTDIIISSTGSIDPIIRSRDIQKTLRQRKQRPMFFIDIAVPRDIDPDVNALDNVYLYDIDDLKEVVEENLASRRDEASRATRIVSEEVEVFSHWLKSLDIQPTIIDITRRSELIAEEELRRTLKKLGDVDEETREALENLTRSLTRKLNHDPIMFLKRGTMAQEGSASRISIARRMFNLDGRHPSRQLARNHAAHPQNSIHETPPAGCVFTSYPKEST